MYICIYIVFHVFIYALHDWLCITPIAYFTQFSYLSSRLK